MRSHDWATQTSNTMIFSEKPANILTSWQHHLHLDEFWQQRPFWLPRWNITIHLIDIYENWYSGGGERGRRFWSSDRNRSYKKAVIAQWADLFSTGGLCRPTRWFFAPGWFPCDSLGEGLNDSDMSSEIEYNIRRLPKCSLSAHRPLCSRCLERIHGQVLRSDSPNTGPKRILIMVILLPILFSTLIGATIPVSAACYLGSRDKSVGHSRGKHVIDLPLWSGYHGSSAHGLYCKGMLSEISWGWLKIGGGLNGEGYFRE